MSTTTVAVVLAAAYKSSDRVRFDVVPVINQTLSAIPRLVKAMFSLIGTDVAELTPGITS